MSLYHFISHWFTNIVRCSWRLFMECCYFVREFTFPSERFGVFRNPHSVLMDSVPSFIQSSFRKKKSYTSITLLYTCFSFVPNKSFRMCVCVYYSTIVCKLCARPYFNELPYINGWKENILMAEKSHLNSIC